MPDPRNDNPTRLYTMTECAKACGRSLAVFRKHYKHGMLPDPVNTTIHRTRKIRLYTLAEVKMLQNHFNGTVRGRKRHYTVKERRKSS
jgi:hypothetical protein